MRAKSALPALLAAGLLSGCAGAPFGGDGIRAAVTQVPAGPRPPLVLRMLPGLRYPAGSRVVIAGPGAVGIRVLSEGFFAAGSPAVSFDGRRVLFAGKRTPRSHWAVYETDLSAARPNLVIGLEGSDCTDPAYLAKGMVIAVCRDPDKTRSLYTSTRAGLRVRRVTFGPGSAFDPAPLQDGRIVFSKWGPGARSALFLLNPDGRQLDPFHGHHSGPALKARARQAADQDVLFLAAADGRRRPARIRRVSFARPASPSASPAEELDALSVEPLPQGGFLAGGRFSGAASDAIFRYPPEDGPPEIFFDDPAYDEVEAVPLLPRPVPAGRPDPLKKEKLVTGKLVCYDSNLSDLRHGPKPGSRRAASVRFLRASPGPGKDPLWGAGKEAVLGSAPVEKDGSFFVEIPPDIPVRVETLDRKGTRIAVSDWIWTRPGEARACFGCHEDRETAPVNRPILALHGAPHPVGLEEVH